MRSCKTCRLVQNAILTQATRTMGFDMSSLFSEVVECMSVHDAELKKMCFLYLVNYARTRPDAAIGALEILQKDLHDADVLIRAQALRTMSYVHVREYNAGLAQALERLLKDKDPYVRKTAAVAVAKLHGHDKDLVKPRSEVMRRLQDLIHDDNSTVAASALVACQDISDRSEGSEVSIDRRTAQKLAGLLSRSSEWSQVYILEALLNFVPQTQHEASGLTEHVVPRLQHGNSAVVLAAVRLLIYLANYMQGDEVEMLYTKLGPPLITLLGKSSEIQFVALRNIDLIVAQAPHLLANKIGAFFCKFSEPLYLKLAKVEIIVRLANEGNAAQVISELKEYAGEIDIDLVRKAIKSIGRVALKIPDAATACIEAVVDLLSTRVTYAVQDCIIVTRDILRKYPQYADALLPAVCSEHDCIEEPGAKAAFAWLIGQFADQVGDAAQLLERALESLQDETTEVQLALLTATVKLFVQRPKDGQPLVPKVLKWVTEEASDPDLRDRGYMYWRLLSTDISFTKRMLLDQKRAVTLSVDEAELERLKELCLELSTLASLYHRSPVSFLRYAKRRTLKDSPALTRKAPPKPQLQRRVTNPFLNGTMVVNTSGSRDNTVQGSGSGSAISPPAMTPDLSQAARFDFMPMPRSTTFTTATTGDTRSTSAIADLLDLQF